MERQLCTESDLDKSLGKLVTPESPEPWEKQSNRHTGMLAFSTGVEIVLFFIYGINR